MITCDQCKTKGKSEEATLSVAVDSEGLITVNLCDECVKEWEEATGSSSDTWGKSLI